MSNLAPERVERGLSCMHDRLLFRTRDLHAEAERILDLDRRLSSKQDYCALLRCLWRLHEGYERCLAVQDWAGTGIDFENRRRAGALLADLAALGAPVVDVEPARVRLAGVAEALGCLYVLEGSTLGGQIVLRRARAALDVTPDRGGSFFHGHGARTGSMWKALLCAINGIPPFSESSDAVEQAAKQTFGSFIAGFAS
jgi:heme oxygenase